MSIGSLLEVGKAALEAGDRQRALSVLLPLANDGEPQAQYSLGMLFSVGQEGESDKNEAIRWHEAAFAQGYAYSAYELGRLYDANIRLGWDHLNTPPYDEMKSHKYYCQALEGLRCLAENGGIRAADLLGRMCLFGHGVKPDANEAIRWFRLCFANGGYGVANTLWNLFSGGYGLPDTHSEEEAVYWFRKMEEHRCQFLVDYRWEDAMVSKGLLERSEMSPRPTTHRTKV